MPLGSFYQQTYFAKNTEEVEAVFGPLILAALKCHCGDNRYKMPFKTLVSENAATWRLHQISG